jgi:hypothetical protein
VSCYRVTITKRRLEREGRTTLTRYCRGDEAVRETLDEALAYHRGMTRFSAVPISDAAYVGATRPHA